MGIGLLDPTTFYINDELNRMLSGVNALFKPYGLSVKDLGFKAY